MANLDLKHKINVPFADKGNRDDIPDTSSDGLVNNTDGLGIKYGQKIPEGGEYFERQAFNGILYKVYAAVKELQDLAISAGFPVDMTKALNILPMKNGGLGANNVVEARQNLELGALAVLDSISNENIKNQTITGDKIANDAITSAKIAANAVTGNKIANKTITASNIADNSVYNNAIVNGAVTDAKFSGILSISKGGTNTEDGFGFKNTYSAAEFNQKIGLSYPFTTQQLAAAIIKLGQPIFCMVYGWNHSSNNITDFPGSELSHRTFINVVDNNQFYIETIDPFNLTTYICNVSGGIAGPWKKTRNYDGTLPVSIGGTGLTYGALGKPTAAHRLEPSQANGSNYKSGDTIYRYSFGAYAVNQYAPSGGTWLLTTFVYTKSTGICRIELGGTAIIAGGTKLDTNNQFDFIHILTKIA